MLVTSVVTVFSLVLPSFSAPVEEPLKASRVNRLPVLNIKRQINVAGITTLNESIHEGTIIDEDSPLQPPEPVALTSTLIDEGWGNLTEGYFYVADSDVNVTDSGDSLTSRSMRLERRDDPVTLRLTNGKFMRVHLGAPIDSTVLRIVFGVLWQTLRSFTTTHSILKQSIDFFADNPDTGNRYNFYTHLPRGSAGVDTKEIEIMFQALYKVITAGATTTLALGFDYLEADGYHIIASGFFRQKFRV